MLNIKNTLSNYIGLVLLIVAAINSYLDASAGKPFDLKTLLSFVLPAIIAFFTGRNNDLSKKTDVQIQAQLNPPTTPPTPTKP